MVIIAMYIKMVAPIRIRLVVTSESFSPKLFATISEAAFATGLLVSGLRNAYHSKKATMTRKDGEAFTLEWKKPIEFKLPEKISNFCSVCSTPISFKDKISPFQMIKLSRFNKVEDYDILDSIIDASRWPGVSVHALKNACKKGNPKVTQRKGGTQTFWIRWTHNCFRCSYIIRNRVSRESYDRIIEKVGEEKVKKKCRKALRMDTHNRS